MVNLWPLRTQPRKFPTFITILSLRQNNASPKNLDNCRLQQDFGGIFALAKVIRFFSSLTRWTAQHLIEGGEALRDVAALAVEGGEGQQHLRVVVVVAVVAPLVEGREALRDVGATPLA